MKKSIMFVLILFVCFISMNSVKAEEGQNKIGSRTQYCKYCTGGTDCLYVALDMETKKTSGVDAEDLITIYKNDFNHKVNFTRLFGWHGTYFYGNQPSDGYSYRDIAESYQNNGCYKYLYYIHISIDMFAFLPDLLKGDPDEYIYYLTNVENDDALVKKIEDKYDGQLILQWFKGEATKNKQYELVLSYGLDDIVFGSVDMVSKFQEITDSIKTSEPSHEYGCAVLTEPIKEKMNWVLNFIKYGGAALAILLGAFDFMKAVLSDEDNATKKAAGNFLKRLIAAVLIFLLPLFIQFILTTVEIEGFNVDAPTCGVGVSE